jgi:hypothetical protein
MAAMPALRSSLDALAESFAASIVAAIRSSNLDDIVSLGAGTPAARLRREPGRPRGSTATNRARAGTPSIAKLAQRMP